MENLEYGEWIIDYIDFGYYAWYVKNKNNNLYLNKNSKLTNKCDDKNFWDEKNEAFTFLKKFLNRNDDKYERK